MPQTPHVEKHFRDSELVRDIVIGMSDGLTVPFALAAGLSNIANSTAIVITGGLAEIAAGSIAMGLGGYLAARSDAEHYATERATEQREVDTIPEVEVAEVEQVRQRSFHRDSTLPQCALDGIDRWACRSRSLWPGQINFEMSRTFYEHK